VTNAAVEAAGPRTESFAAPAGRYLGFIVVGAAVVLILLGLKSQGTGAFGLVGFSVAFALVAWVVLIRPRVTAHRNGLLMRNMLRDTFVPWATIKSCRVGQTLQIGTRDRVYHGLGLTKSARQATREQRQKRGDRREIVGPNFGMTSHAGARTIGSPSAKDGKLEVNLSKQEQIGGSYFSHAEQRIEWLAQQGKVRSAGSTPAMVWDPLPIGALCGAVLGIVFAFFN
jgi:hypothetical protein